MPKIEIGNNMRKVITLAEGLHRRLRIKAMRNGNPLQEETDTAIKAYLDANRALLKSGAKMPARKPAKNGK